MAPHHPWHEQRHMQIELPGGQLLARERSVRDTQPSKTWELSYVRKTTYKKKAQTGLARKVVFTTNWFFSAISAYLCDLCVRYFSRLRLRRDHRDTQRSQRRLQIPDRDYFSCKAAQTG